MKPRTLLRTVTICFAAIACIAATLYFQKKLDLTLKTHSENSIGIDKSQGEFMIWQSLSRHLLSFNP